MPIIFNHLGRTRVQPTSMHLFPLSSHICSINLRIHEHASTRAWTHTFPRYRTLSSAASPSSNTSGEDQTSGKFAVEFGSSHTGYRKRQPLPYDQRELVNSLVCLDEMTYTRGVYKDSNGRFQVW